MDNMQLAGRIRAFRKLKGYTQQQLADRLAVSVAVLGAIERGNRIPDAKIVTEISQQLGIAVEELTGESNGLL
ncbi:MULTISPECIES: helix-turn-helix domain-containing protein [unclassified Paenibacillus]|uniref:helix-turn-helix domain-containing protein n=1 Tax=unclassified Paenibacillus TaxID=185978 RepID=UPI001C11FB0D|nr:MULTISPECIES: helix-turn-helix transcriptional regulator [unclassified Paenibacillus]MBU5445620.1 helix-turn-helix transcriptional regulator [Paenibacillus sp. MSJ-34]CAH0121551.1 hypothetical protein PAE9249_04082 [Paenibacillus sp. CECT 9249]